MKYFCAYVIRHESLVKSQVLFKIGDIGVRFYIILKGKVGVYKVKQLKKEMFYKDFIEYMKYLRIGEEYYILDKTLEENKDLINGFYEEYLRQEELYFSDQVVESNLSFHNLKMKDKYSVLTNEIEKGLKGFKRKSTVVSNFSPLKLNENERSPATKQVRLSDASSKAMLVPKKKSMLSMNRVNKYNSNVNMENKHVGNSKISIKPDIEVLTSIVNSERKKTNQNVKKIIEKKEKPEGEDLIDNDFNGKEGKINRKSTLITMNDENSRSSSKKSLMEENKIRPKKYKRSILERKDMGDLKNNLNLSNKDKQNNDTRQSGTNSTYLNKYLSHNRLYEKVIYDYNEIIFNKINTLSSFRIFEYYKVLDLSTGSYFGDFAIEGKQKRTATIIAEDDIVHLGVIDASFYLSYIKNEKQKATSYELNSLIENYIFSHIKRVKFEKIYLDLLVRQVYQTNEVIISDKNKISHMYFLKSKSVQVKNNKNIVELYDIINEVLDVIGISITSCVTLYEKSKTLKNMNTLIDGLNGNCIEYSSLLNNTYFLQLIKQRNKINSFRSNEFLLKSHVPSKIFIAEGYKIFNILEYFLKKDYSFFDLVPVNNNTELYKISVNSFEKIVLNEPFTSDKIREYVKSSIIPLVIRLSQSITYQIDLISLENKLNKEKLSYSHKHSAYVNTIIKSNAIKNGLTILNDSSNLINTSNQVETKRKNFNFLKKIKGRKGKVGVGSGFYEKFKILMASKFKRINLNLMPQLDSNWKELRDTLNNKENHMEIKSMKSVNSYKNFNYLNFTEKHISERKINMEIENNLISLFDCLSEMKSRSKSKNNININKIVNNSKEDYTSSMTMKISKTNKKIPNIRNFFLTSKECLTVEGNEGKSVNDFDNELYSDLCYNKLKEKEESKVKVRSSIKIYNDSILKKEKGKGKGFALDSIETISINNMTDFVSKEDKENHMDLLKKGGKTCKNQKKIDFFNENLMKKSIKKTEIEYYTKQHKENKSKNEILLNLKKTSFSKYARSIDRCEKSLSTIRNLKQMTFYVNK